jgi:hypothetical protein
MIWMTLLPLALAVALGLAYELPRLAAWACRSKEARAAHAANQAQLRSYVLPSHLEPHFTPKQKHDFRRTFAEFDADGGGEINFGEFQKVIELFDHGASDDTVRGMFEAADSDKSGEISFGEFMTSIHKAREEQAKHRDLAAKNGQQHDKASEFALMADKIDAKVQLGRKNLIAQLFLLMTFLVLIGSSSSVFNFFKCDEYEEFTLLSLDYSIDCDSP